MLRTDKDGKFRILQLTDIQFTKDLDKQSIEVMDKTIAKANPDLIVLTGDQISGEYLIWRKRKVSRILSQISEYFDSKKIPWTMCFGNHDGLWKRNSKSFMLEFYKKSAYFVGDMQSSEKCLVCCDDKESVSNYFIPVLGSDDKPVYGILVFDCETVLTSPYRCLDDNQIEFYRHISQKYLGLPIALFMHLPTNLMQDAYDKKDDKNIVREFLGEIEKPEVGKVYYATKGEEKNTIFLDNMSEFKNIKGIFVGHDHLSNFAVNYNMAENYNLLMAYGRLSTYAFTAFMYFPFSCKDRKVYKNYPKGGRVIDLYADGNMVTIDLLEDLQNNKDIVMRNRISLKN